MAANIQSIKPDIGFGNWQSIVQHGIEASTQTWKVGAPLVNSSGSLAEATTGTTGYRRPATSTTTGPPSPGCTLR
jgi:hypothetical protein